MSLVSLLSLAVERPRHGAHHHHLHRAQSSSISATTATKNSSLPGSCSGKTHSSAGSRGLLTFH